MMMNFLHAFECTKCHSNVMNEHHCDSCSNDLVVWGHAKKHVCCLYNMWYEAETNICQWCHAKCLTCQSNLKTSCTSCHPGTKFTDPSKTPGECTSDITGGKSDIICATGYSL